jgi:flagellar biosynthesis protein FlhF
MKTKIYFASSVPAAFDIARQELGADALFVRSVPTPIHLRHFGRFEVTFGWDSAPAPLLGGDQYQSERSQGNRSPAVIAAKLVEVGFSRDTAAAIASDAACTSGDPDAAVLDELTRRILVATSEPAHEGGRTMAFIGPPGRGKTTSLIKIAVSLGLSRRLPVRVYSVGTHSVGAKEQMARFAGIPGARCQACKSLTDLGLALQRDAGNQLRLIDTPGISPADRAKYPDLAEFFAARPQIEKHLVLRAEATSADMLGMIARFSGLAPSRLLFTGLDEASSKAAMLETLIRSRIPAAFTGTGPQIPADLEEANAERLARSAWPVSASGSSSRTAGAAHALAAA